MSAQDRIRERVEQFVEELNELIRRAALEAVSNSLQGGTPAPAAKPAPRRGRPAASPAPSPTPSATPTRRRRAGGGAKRAPEELEQLTQDLLEYIQVNHGEGIEGIARGLRQSSKDLQLPMKKLLSTGQVVKEGQKRSTKYYPA